MKILRLMIVPVLLAFLMSCDGNRQNATLGNTADTANSVEGAVINPTNPPDTSQRGKDSTSSHGNADPGGSIKKSNQ